jgi:hypothetical protein
MAYIIPELWDTRTRADRVSTVYRVELVVSTCSYLSVPCMFLSTTLAAKIAI